MPRILQSKVSKPVNKPQPVQVALEVLDDLAAEGEVLVRPAHGQDKDLRKILPALAMQMHRAGAEITAEMLRARIDNNDLDFQTNTSQSQIRSYDGVVARLKSPPLDTIAQLMRAVEKGDLATIQRLHAEGADIKARHNHAVISAAAKGHLEVIKYLHEQGADITAKDNLAAIFSAKNGHLNVLKYLSSHDEDIIVSAADSIVIWAASKGHVDVLEHLREHGADITARDNQAVILAAANGHVDVLEHLREHGADITVRDNQAVTWAATNGHLDALEYLHAQGVDITARDNKTVIMAAANGQLEVVRYLHEHGADITAEDNVAVIQAFQNNRFAVLDYLHAHGASCPDKVKDKLERYRHWKSRLGSDSNPRYLVKFREHYFKKDCFLAVRAMLEKEGESGLFRDNYAYHISTLFQSEARVLQYLERWGEAGKQPLHDIGHMIDIPQEGRLDLKAWGDGALKQGPEMAGFVKFADKLKQPLKAEDGSTWSLRKTKEEIAKHAYPNGFKNTALARMAMDAKWKDDNFNEALGLIAKYKKRYGENGVKPDRIPEIKFDGDVFNMPDYECLKLPDGDVRGLFLGDYTGCCQHIGGAGSEYAAHGYLKKNGGFYVVQHKQTAQIIAQSWAWRGKDGEIVLDSLESLGSKFNQEAWTPICQKLGDIFKNRSDITRFTIGKGGNTPADMPFTKAENPVKAKIQSAEAFCDSKTQYEVWARPAAAP